MLPTLGAAADQRVRQTIRWWQAWITRGVLDGPHRDAVTRSLLTLKLMTYAPSGALVARYPGGAATVAQTIRDGRNNKMPAWGEFLGQAKTHVLASYVWGLSNAK